MLRWTLLAGLLLPLAGLACSGDGDSPASTQTVVSARPSATATLPLAPTVADGSPAATPSPAPTSEPGELPEVRLQRVYDNLSFEQATGMYQLPDGRILVTERAGRVLVFEDDEGVEDAELFLDLTDRVLSGNVEQGLLGLAVAPDFETSGYVFLDYTASDPQRAVISRFTLDDDGMADPDSELVILEVSQPFSNHNGGQIAFGPDGYFYIGLGDGGNNGTSGRDPQGNGQDPSTLLASILRIDVGKASRSSPYEVPEDNPLVGTYARAEIWAYGLRNPWRFSFDTETGDLWAGDVGQNAWEEIDLIEPGANYGWSVMEGTHCLSGSSCDRGGLTLPVIDYSHSEGCSVTGGFVYRGDAIPALDGAYVYSDYCAGKLWALRYDGSQVTQQAEIADPGFSVSSFAVDNQGELYVLEFDQSGGIYRIVP